MSKQSQLLGSTWQGYLRQDGRKGVRNVVLVIYTVECAKHVAHAIAAGEPDTHVVGFPGCFDNAYAVRLMLALVRHANIGAVLAVGLGCEYTQPQQLAARAAESGRLAEWFYIQESGGTAQSVAKGKQIVTNMHDELRHTPRVEMTLADLVVGAECGGSDATSGIAGNPTVGRVFDRIVDAGGAAIFEEIVEMIGLRDVLRDRAASPAARDELTAAYDKAVAYCRNVRQCSISPGNFVGGLTTIEEKSLGAFSKCGDRTIQGVIKVAQHPPRPGLWLLDTVPDPHFMQFGYTNPNDTEGIMDLISAGSHIILFITGRGSVIGSPIAPLIKITGNSQTYCKMPDDIDFDAGRLLSGERTLDELGDELLAMVVNVASGELTKPERLGHREYFITYKHQDTPPLEVGCRG
jgi:altronate dehydratase large subunit